MTERAEEQESRSSGDSARDLIRRLKDGDTRAEGELFRRYFSRLTRLAQARLPARLGRVEDEEDVAASALESFFAAIRRGKFSDIHQRDQLLGLLLTFARRKSADRVQRYCAAKRGGGAVRGESAFASGSRPGTLDGLFEAGEPGPEEEAALHDALRVGLDALEEPFRKVAVLWIEGCSQRQIAGELGVSLRTVERRLRSIRGKWERLFAPGTEPGSNPTDAGTGGV